MTKFFILFLKRFAKYDVIAAIFKAILSNQVFHYTPYIKPKHVTSLWGPSSCHCTRATQLLSKKYPSGGEPLATLCPIWSARDLSFKPPAPETNALPLDQLAAKIFQFWQTLVDLQAGIWSRICRNSLSTQKKIKLKNFISNFRMFFPYVTSWQLYNNNSCLKFEIYYRHDLIAVTDGTIFLSTPTKTQ